MSRILDHARRELDEFGPVKFNITRVIEESGVSKSSVYHHFGGRDGVISAVEVQRLIDERLANNAIIGQILANVNSGEECLDVIEAGLHLASNAIGRKNRSHRIAVVASAQHIPVLTESVAEETPIADAALTDMLAGARDRGLITPAESLEDIARYMSSMFIGRSAVDTYESEEFDAAWIRMSMGVLRGFLQPSPSKKSAS